MVNYEIIDLGDLTWSLGIQVAQGKNAVLLSKKQGLGMQN